MDANAELDPPRRHEIGIAHGHAALHVDRAAHRVHDAGELHQDAVAGSFKDAAAFGFDRRVDQLRASARSRRIAPSSSAPVSRP
jgi:hypothetical protein